LVGPPEAEKPNSTREAQPNLPKTGLFVQTLTIKNPFVLDRDIFSLYLELITNLPALDQNDIDSLPETHGIREINAARPAANRADQNDLEQLTAVQGIRR